LLILVFVLLLTSVSTLAAPSAQVQSSEELANQLLDTLTPEERVGQLFVVDFSGSELTDESLLAELITRYHIGGVNFNASNNNFSHSESPLVDTWKLIQDIQRIELENAAERQTIPATGETFTPAAIPLFIAIEQPGDGAPRDQLITGLTAMPSQLAIGATWDPALAQQVGEQLGLELSQLGFNFILGPSMNVHSNPRPELAGDLGTSSFSGSPFWVGEIGQAYIHGLHSGSNDSLAVIARNFPGFVGADQPLRDEIPTIRKTLDQLLLTELPPFFVITDLGEDPAKLGDGLLLTHARYQAFQSNISNITPPISLDPQALNQLLSLQEFSTWHANGGLIVSDELGSQAIRRYYIQIGQKYDPRFISRDALLAGNDLLLTGNFIDPDDPNLHTSTINTLSFFAQKYRDDVAFAQLVDEAVLRILTLKFDLYDNSFSETSILKTTLQLDRIGGGDQVSFEIARQGATLINPAVENLQTVLPNPPAANDFVVIFTDTATYQPCADCPEVQYPARTAFEEVILRLYGPAGDGLIVPGNVASYTFENLNEAVTQSNDPESLLIANIQRAEWLVFLQVNSTPSRPASLALSRFLSETPELIQDKKIVVFGLGAPYYLNATEISSVTAYYGLYSKQPQFIEVAARLLFKELKSAGASPVTVNSVGYVIDQALTPNPAQVIPLSISKSDAGNQQGSGDTSPTISFTQGDSIILQTGSILDMNNNPIRDDTLVRFTLISTNPEGVSSQRELTGLTSDGIAQASFILDTAGTLRVQAASGQPPALSNEIQIAVAGSGQPSETPAAGQDQPEEPTPTPLIEDDSQQPEETRELNNLVDWLLSMVVIIFMSLFAYQFGALAGQVRWGVRWGLTSLIGGLLVITYISFNLPGAATLVGEYHIWGIVLSVTGGSLIGWAAGLIWRNLK
jgi:beta-N-acetylhexosaminidase